MQNFIRCRSTRNTSVDCAARSSALIRNVPDRGSPGGAVLCGSRHAGTEDRPDDQYRWQARPGLQYLDKTPHLIALSWTNPNS